MQGRVSGIIAPGGERGKSMRKGRVGAGRGAVLALCVVLVVSLTGCSKASEGAGSGSGTLNDAIKARTDASLLSVDVLKLDNDVRDVMRKTITKAESKEMEGNILLTKDRYAQAVEAYKEASTLYEQALDGKKVMKDLADAKAKAERAAVLAEGSSEEQLKEPRRLVTNADGYEQAGDYAGAIAEYGKAQAAYAKLVSGAGTATLDDAVAARTAMLASKKQIKDISSAQTTLGLRAVAPGAGERPEGKPKGPKPGSFADVAGKAVIAETSGAKALEDREYGPARALFVKADEFYRQAAALEAKRDAVIAGRGKAEDAMKAADDAFKSDARTASFQRGKESLVDGGKALSEDDYEKAAGFFAKAMDFFATARDEAKVMNDFSAAQGDYAAAGSAADEAFLAKYAAAEWKAAKDKAADAAAKASAGDYKIATTGMKDATDALKAASAKALTAENTDKAAPVVARLEEEVARRDKFAAEDTLAQLEALVPSDARMPGLRDKVAATPGPKKEITVDLGGGVKMEMVLIRPGSFMMGSEKGAPDEKPVHKVRITRPFYMGKYEVTQEQWQAVMGTSPSKFKGAKNPVEQVSWNDCQDFMKKLSEKVGGGAFRLPTEAEWEYASRAGTTTEYSFGDSDSAYGEYAWYSANSGSATHPVGQKKPNAWGLYDVHGNLWEWCSDFYDTGYYAQSPADDPTGGGSGGARVLRGGSWGDDATFCRAAYRCSFDPSSSYYYYGLRAARTLE